jgi:hypothetical protein
MCNIKETTPKNLRITKRNAVEATTVSVTNVGLIRYADKKLPIILLGIN